MRRSRSVLFVHAIVVLAVVAVKSRAASAEPEPAIDVVIRDEAPPPRRLLLVEWNPLPLFTIGKLSANVVIAPLEHHALVLSPFYAWTKTAPVYIFDDEGNPTQLPEQSFKGFGTELGYRYYTGKGGPRGLFIGPSLILGSFTATAQNGAKTHFVDVGVAGDVGYQMLLGDRVAVSLGGGAQYQWTSKTIPRQQFPSWIFANRGVAPRVLASLGWAF